MAFSTLKEKENIPDRDRFHM